MSPPPPVEPVSPPLETPPPVEPVSLALEGESPSVLATVEGALDSPVFFLVTFFGGLNGSLGSNVFS